MECCYWAKGSARRSASSGDSLPSANEEWCFLHGLAPLTVCRLRLAARSPTFAVCRSPRGRRETTGDGRLGSSDVVRVVPVHAALEPWARQARAQGTAALGAGRPDPQARGTAGPERMSHPECRPLPRTPQDLHERVDRGVISIGSGELVDPDLKPK